MPTGPRSLASVQAVDRAAAALGLVGRADELGRIRRFITDAARGAGRCLLVVGEPGIGKSSLLAAAPMLAPPDSRIVRFRGAEAESHLAYAAVIDLIEPLLREADVSAGLGEAARTALEGLVSGASAAPAGAGTSAAMTICRAALGAVLSAAVGQRCLVMVVDDAHWLDESSAEVLSYVARRIEGERVAMLVGVRSGSASGLTVADAEHLDVTGLSGDATSGLLAPFALAGTVAADLHAATAGNPLAVLEIVRALGPDERAARAPLPRLPAPGPAISEAFSRRIAALAEPTRDALAIAAANGSGQVATLHAVLATLGHGADVLDPAAQEQIIVFARETVDFTHPLMRLVSYSSATAARRRRIHGAFAAVLGRADPTRAVWHLAESALGPDDAIAASVEAVAVETRARGALPVAGELFERAGDLSTGRDERERRWFAAARSFDDSARPAQAARILERILASTEDPLMRADVMLLLGVYCAFGESARRGCEILRTEAMRIEPRDPARALLLLASAYTAAVLGVDFSAAAEITTEAGRVADGAGAGPVGVLVAGALDLQTALFEGRYDDAARLRDPMVQMATALSTGGIHEGDFLLQTTAFADLVMDGWQTAWTTMNGVVRRGRSAGRDGGLAFALAVASEAALRLGRWADAYVSARHAGDLYVDPADMSASRLTSFALCARVEAHLGLADSCRENAARALAGAEPVGAAMLVIWARHALGLLALAEGDHVEAVRQLELVAAVADRSGAQDPGYLWWPADLIEAYWRCGRPADALRIRAQLRFYGERTGSRSMMMVVSRWEAMLGPVERAEAHFADALAAGEALGAPFEVARTELLLAEWRAANTGSVEEPLVAARLTFERLGASAWVDRCEEVGPPRPSEDPVMPARILTERELETALWAARGKTNREIADELYLSPKTIEHTLGRVYRKLGVRSRTQLAVLLAESA